MSDNISYEFGSFRLIPAERQLLRDEQPVSLPPKAFDTLVALVENCGHALTKDDLIRRVWPDSFVEESNLNHNISVIRKVLNGGNGGEGYVETVRGFGFRFKADVRPMNGEAVLIHRQTRTQLIVREQEIENRRTLSHQRSETTRSAARPFVIAALSLILVGGLLFVYFGFIRRGPGNASNEQRPGFAGSSSYVVNPAAREAYLRGRYFLGKRTLDDVTKACLEFRRAIQIDSNYALAYVGLADCQLLGASTAATTENAKDLALKAIALDENSAEAHATLAYYLGAVEWNWMEAEQEFEKSIAFDPTYSTARHWHAYNLASLGRMDEAVLEIKRAKELDPQSVIISTDVGHILFLAGRYDEAITQYLAALQMDSEFRVARWRLGEVYAQQRRYDEAVTELKKAISLDGGNKSAIELWIAQAAAVNGRREGALEILSRWYPEADARGQWYSMALIYAGLGDNDSAFAWLEKSFNAHDGQLALLKIDPMLKGIRDDPRYLSLLQRVNLPPD
jgi:DNA-binding winged helix-turn-helix (wHTH) protein/tetratricopeptide (TPR) repeat protein